MKKTINLIIILLIFAVGTQATDLQGLIDKFRIRIQEENLNTSFFSDTDATVWLNLAQHRIVRLGGYIEKTIVVDTGLDSAAYALPAGFKTIVGAMVRMSGGWYSAFLNPFFAKDTAVASYFIAGNGPDSFNFYFRSYTGIVVDSVSVTYKSDVAELEDSADTSEVPLDLEGLVIDEAVRYYLEGKQNWQVAGQLWQQTRIDMGVLKQKEQ